jgi:hypothetical protein
VLEISRHHVQLIKIGEQRALALRHDQPLIVVQKTGAGFPSAPCVLRLTEPGSDADFIFDRNTPIAN